MKNLIAILTISMATLAFGQNTTGNRKTSQKTPGKNASATPQPVTIPTDAVANPDGTFSYTDKLGRNWRYAKTPFGISKIEVRPSGVAEPAPVDSAVTAIDKGDTIVFQRKTPFGATSWEKKKTDLNDDEKRILEAQKQPKPE